MNVQGADEAVIECVLLTRAQLCQGPQHRRLTGMAKPSLGQAQEATNAF